MHNAGVPMSGLESLAPGCVVWASVAARGSAHSPKAIGAVRNSAETIGESRLHDANLAPRRHSRARLVRLSE